LLLASVLVDCVVLTIVGLDRWFPFQWSHPMLGVLFSLAFSQVSLTAIWAALGQKSAPWRLALAVLVLTGWSLALSATLPNVLRGYTATDWVAMLLSLTLVVLVPLSIARAVGLRMAESGELDALGSRNARRQRWQFSLGYLFAWTTAVAVVLGMFQYTVRIELLPVGRLPWIKIAVMGVSYGALAPPTLWAVLGTRCRILRIVMLCLATGAILGLYRLLATDFEHQAALSLICLLDVLLLWISLGVVRVAGYRLTRSGGSEFAGEE